MDVVIPFLLFSVFVVGVVGLVLWWLVPVALPFVAGYTYWNALALALILYVIVMAIKGL